MQLPTLQELTIWFARHAGLLGAVALVSVALLVVTFLATPWLVAKLPANYWLRRSAPRPPLSAFTLFIDICRFLLGSILVMLGLVMMITPGPGLVMLLIGISVAEFPGKNHLLVYLATRPKVFATLNWIRTHRGSTPFIHPINTPPVDQMTE